MKRIKVNIYNNLGEFKFELDTDLIENIDSLQFNESINGGQGGFNLELNLPFDDFSFSEEDLIEYVIFDDDFKNGIHKFTGVIKGIPRGFNRILGEKITLEIQGLIILLSDFSITKNYTGTIKDVIDSFITDFHANINITGEMEYLGNDILKNNISSTENINIDVSGTFFEGLKLILENHNFFIDQNGNISLEEENIIENIIIIDEDVINIDIDKTGEINISLNTNLEISVGQKVLLENINSNLNLENKRISELAFGLDSIEINCGKIIDYNLLK